ncbi:serine protease 7-like [Drosophila gunungcola]|uniref:serine protease 7-like n=1 Tax=Drosophila gunungcola TaxID=103775 RepID=UPI0022E0816F|nr:serine protease 7-like [Drosophila gunungcola]
MKLAAAVILCILIVCEARGYSVGGCRNPNQRTGYCLEVSLCPPLVSLMNQISLTRSESQFLQATQCGYGKNSQVLACCTEDTDFDRTTSVPFSSDIPKILPYRSACGGNTILPRILSGMETAVSEFAWMVLLEYRLPSGKGFSTNCSGSLINDRYVLTAAHCISDSLVFVILGEHDTRTPIDCNASGKRCGPKIQRLDIEEIRVHERYSNVSNNYLHDIALIRLNKPVSYSVTIQPICLPSTVGEEVRQSGQVFTVAGWGRTMRAARSDTKQKLQVGLYDKYRCRQRYLSENIALEDSQICAGGQQQQHDSCAGDSGGPLMRFRDNTWVLEGIVSFGYKCGALNWPAVYTNVAYYDRWIKMNMRP